MTYLEEAFEKLRSADDAIAVAADRDQWTAADEARSLQMEALVYAIAAVAAELPSGEAAS